MLCGDARAVVAKLVRGEPHVRPAGRQSGMRASGEEAIERQSAIDFRRRGSCGAQTSAWSKRAEKRDEGKAKDESAGFHDEGTIPDKSKA
jgi:hypothetical protein